MRLRIIEALSFRHWDSVPLRQNFDRFGKGQVIVFHHKLEYVTSGIAAEALINLKCAMHSK